MPKSRPPPRFHGACPRQAVSRGAGSAGLPAPDGRAGSHRTDCGRAGSGMAVLLSAEGRQFEPTTQAIRNWVAQAERDEGRRADGLSSAEREEIRRLRRENRRVREEREWRFSCLPKVDRDWQKVRRTREGSSEPFARRTPGLLGRSDPGGRPVHESESGHRECPTLGRKGVVCPVGRLARGGPCRNSARRVGRRVGGRS